MSDDLCTCGGPNGCMIHNEHINDGGRNFIEKATAHIGSKYCTNCSGIDPASCFENHPICIFCGVPVDAQVTYEFRRLVGTEHPELTMLKARLAEGYQRDKDGRWMHVHTWQCLIAWQAVNGALPLPDGISG